LEKPDFPTNANAWISSTAYDLKQGAQDKLLEAGYDEAYSQYLKAQSITNVLGTYIKVKGGDLEKDFENIYDLAKVVQGEHEVRTDHLEYEYLKEKYGENKREAVKDWKPATERQKQAFTYLNQLVRDVDILINERHGHPILGFTHYGDGDKTKELEEFINGGE